MSTCATCGATWVTGKDGSHSCTDALLKKIDAMEQQHRAERILIADLMLLYATLIPVGNWDGVIPKANMIEDRLKKLGWAGGKGPQPSAEVIALLGSRSGL